MQQLLKHSLNLLLPPRCIACNQLVESPGALCSACWRNISFISDPHCSICGFPFEYHNGEEAICGACINEKPQYDIARSAVSYNENSRKLISQFKYSDKLQGTNTFAKWMVNAGFDCLKNADFIMPVPLHKIRLFTRKYNQSALLAKEIARHTGITLLPEGLIRTRHNPPQASLSRKVRMKNVKGIFKVKAKYQASISGKTVLLTDDVMTTGATIKECTKALKKAGVAQVNILTLARALEK